MNNELKKIVAETVESYKRYQTDVDYKKHIDDLSRKMDQELTKRKTEGSI